MIILHRLKWWFINKVTDYHQRRPDLVIGDWPLPYMLRWWVIPRNRFFNIYLHRICRSDDDRALHDHPWSNMSIILNGQLLEHTIKAGGIHQRKRLRAGDIVVRLDPRYAHRLEVDESINAETVWSLFITGPVVRDWGFHCPNAGWVHRKDFADPADSGKIGKGCDQ